MMVPTANLESKQRERKFIMLFL